MKETNSRHLVCVVVACAFASAAFGQQQQDDHRDHHEGNHAGTGQTYVGPGHPIGSIGYGFNAARIRSRSGIVHYGTVSNGYSRSVPFLTPRPQGLPPVASRNYLLKHYGGLWYGMRVGYVSYSAGFVDDQFFYPYYSFDPDAGQVVLLSPWYYYPSLPPYIDASRTDPAVVTPLPDPGSASDPVVIDTPPPLVTPPTTPTTSVAPAPLKKDLDQAQKDLVAAWQNADMSAMERLLPPSGTVTVHVDGEDPYTLNSKDFYDLLHDGIQGTQTLSYVLDTPKMINDDMATVVAHHTFMDPFGSQREIDHSYTLVQSPNGWVISDFASGSYKPATGG